MQGILVAAILAVYCQCVTVHGTVIYEKRTVIRRRNDEDNKNLAQATRNDEDDADFRRQMLTDQTFFREMVKTSGDGPPFQPSKTETEVLKQEFNLLKRRRRDTPDKDTDANYELMQKWILTFPGTKWCGPDTKVENYDDLGTEADTDKCCRDHDNCFDYILSGESKYELKNDGQFTRLHCKCDKALHHCLSQVNSWTSNTIGNIYFNIARQSCFGKDHPSTCKQYATPMEKICLKHEKDTTSPKVYQFFPARMYKQLPNPVHSNHTMPF